MELGKAGKKIIKGIHTYSFGILRRIFDWTVAWAPTKYGMLALFLLAFAESSFFPIPPDVLLIAMCIAAPKKSLKFALICASGSVLGGMFGYLIGFGLYESVGALIINSLGYQAQFETVGRWFTEHAFLSILASAFTPIPYKVFTIAAGVWKINFGVFILASFIGRSMRFFLVGGLIMTFGKKMKSLIEKYFDLFSIGVLLLIVIGFVVPNAPA